MRGEMFKILSWGQLLNATQTPYGTSKEQPEHTARYRREQPLTVHKVPGDG